MFLNSIIIQITSADIPGALRMLDNMCVALSSVKITGDISVSCVINKRYFQLVQKELTLRGDQVQSLGRVGILDQLYRIMKRPVLVSVMLLIGFLSLFIQTRILFVEVEGNERVPTHFILEKAAQSGISFGAACRDVRSEQVKNVLLSGIPELQWIGVNTSGCVARISVKERSGSDSVGNEHKLASYIVASQDGVITECTVRRGNRLCDIGQAVTTGQVLVSGYNDCGLIVRTTHVDAEITADTLRYLQAITPKDYMFRADESKFWRGYSLLIGKKLINFFQDSGISDSTCVKMYSKKYLRLPGGQLLPVAIIIEDRVYFQMETGILPEESCDVLLQTAAQDYLISNMVSGKIVDTVTYVQPTDGIYRLTGHYACNEMIGQVVYEENVYNYGEND